MSQGVLVSVELLLLLLLLPLLGSLLFLTLVVLLACCAVSLRYSAGAQANILWSAGVKDKSEVGQVISRLEAAGMPTLDISGMDAARVREAKGGGRQSQQMGSVVKCAVPHPAP